MHIYRLSEPIDDFDGLIPLHEWLDGSPSRLAWALQAVLALSEPSAERHQCARISRAPCSRTSPRPCAVRAATRAARLLTGRQRELLRLVAAGHDNIAIARRLGPSPYTVRKHLENAFARLDVTSRTAAVAKVCPDATWLDPPAAAFPARDRGEGSVCTWLYSSGFW